MARQYLQDGPYIDPPVASGGALVSTAAEAAWSGPQYTPIFANDPKAGKIYHMVASGIITTGASGTLIITPTYGGTGGIALGASATQTVPVSLTNVPWIIEAWLTFRVIGAAGANSTAVLAGYFAMSGTLATAGSGTVIPFGGTSASVDATVNKDITIQKTLSVAGSWTTQNAFVHAIN